MVCVFESAAPGLVEIRKRKLRKPREDPFFFGRLGLADQGKPQTPDPPPNHSRSWAAKRQKHTGTSTAPWGRRPMEKFRAVLDLHLKHRNTLGYVLVLGWVLIAVVIIVLLIFTSITRCLSPVSFLQLKFWKIYLEQEQQILKSQATEHATKLAKENIKCFFECSHPKEYNTPSIKDWQQISSLYTFNPKEQYYSILHKYVNRKEKNQSIRSSKEDVVVPVLGFVDSSDMNSTPDL
ncbi:calcium homeostasis modulator protein 6 isoform X2 [Pseudorca crassidens]